METPYEAFLGSVVGLLRAVTRPGLGFQLYSQTDFPA